jgi:cytochrome c oxidase subunit 3
MALGVRAAQLGNNRHVRLFMALTIALACVFMVVKYVEYSHKFHDGFLAGKYFTGKGLMNEEQQQNLQHTFRLKDDPSRVYFRFKPSYPVNADQLSAAFAARKMPLESVEPADAAMTVSATQLLTSGALNGADDDVNRWGKYAGVNAFALQFSGKPHIFFGVYFAMTGLHGLHVVVGILLLAWIWARARRAEFSGAYYTPVENTGLYWHLVDLIWIFLFPLLYLVR